MYVYVHNRAIIQKALTADRQQQHTQKVTLSMLARKSLFGTKSNRFLGVTASDETNAMSGMYLLLIRNRYVYLATRAPHKSHKNVSPRQIK